MTALARVNQDANNFVYRLRTNVADSRNTGAERSIEAAILRAVPHGHSKYNPSSYSNLGFIDARYINSKESAVNDKNEKSKFLAGLANALSSRLSATLWLNILLAETLLGIRRYIPTIHRF